MRILIPIIGFGRAGGYRVLSELASHWVRLGEQVDFLVDHRADTPYFPTLGGIRRFDRHGLIELREPDDSGFAASGNAFSIFLGMWRALRSLAGDYDIVLANQSLTAWPVRFSPRPRGGRYYYVQAYEPEYYAVESGIKPMVLRWLSRHSYRLDLMRIVNAPIYMRYVDLKADNWIPPGLNLANFTQRGALPGEDGRWTLGVIGRSEPTKGTADALAAFELIARKHPLATLRIAYGNLPSGWSHPRAEIVVPANDRELGEFYRSLDVMLAPGTQQLGACHYPVLEAMASGAAVITTGYLPADRGNAWIVPIHAPEAIAKAFDEITCLSHAEMHVRIDLARNAVLDFEWEAVATKFLRLLRASAREGST